MSRKDAAGRKGRDDAACPQKAGPQAWKPRKVVVSTLLRGDISLPAITMFIDHRRATGREVRT